MTLTNRLLFFFLSTLAAVLLGFSVALYVLAHSYLHQQTQERLDAVLNSVCAAIEVDSDGVEWEPKDRQQNLVFSTFAEPVYWNVVTSDGQIVARSEGAQPYEISASDLAATNAQQNAVNNSGLISGSWLTGQRWIHSEPESVHRPNNSPTADDQAVRYQSLSVSAGVSLTPLRFTLNRLATALTGLSVVVWCVAFGAGRLVCRRALLPVQQMASAAAEINGQDLTQRLPPLRTQDELGNLNCTFNQMLDRLQEAFERQQRFTGDASHQLRTPLTAIIGQVEVALRRQRSDADYRQTLETVQQRATHLARMVESLLFLARADHEAQLPALESVKLTDWLPKHLHTWSQHPRAADITFDTDANASCVVFAQPALLAELLNILLDNACKFSEPGTPVTAWIRQSAAEVVLSVEDQGCGIGASDLKNLSVPFFRSTQARNSGIDGVGLGLSIARRLSKHFGAELKVTSNPNAGSCFTITFPAEPYTWGRPD